MLLDTSAEEMIMSLRDSASLCAKAVLQKRSHP